MVDLMERLAQLGHLAYRWHYECEDPWYSCPKSEDGCVNEHAGEDCNCGADAHNAKVKQVLDEVVQQLEALQRECHIVGGEDAERLDTLAASQISPAERQRILAAKARFKVAPDD